MRRFSPSPALLIGLISIPIFIGALDLTVVSAVLPQVIYDLEIPLQTGLDDAAWIVTGYLLSYSIAMLIMGRLSDLFGRRKIYILALTLFAAGSLLVAVSDTWLRDTVLRIYYLLGGGGRPDPSQVALNMIIFTRMLQAFGGGAMVPVGMAMVGDIFPAGQRGKAIGVIAAIDTAGWVIGHLYGGILVRYFHWHMIFWLNLPVCILWLLMLALAFKGMTLPSTKNKMDWLGALLATGFLAALNIGLGSSSDVNISISSTSGTSPYDLRFLFAALFFLAAFLLQQRIVQFPLIDLSLFRKRNFAAASLANFLTGACLFIAIAMVPLFINSLIAETLEQGAWESGFMLSALTVPIALASFPGGWLTEKYGYRMPAVSGLLLAIFGFALMSRWQLATTYATMIPQLAITGAGIGLTIAPIATAVIEAAPDAYRGAASALVLTFRLIGMTVGVSSITSYGLHRADLLAARLIPAGATIAEAFNTSLAILVKVIDETFLIAGGVCLLAFLLVFLLRKEKNNES